MNSKTPIVKKKIGSCCSGKKKDTETSGDPGVPSVREIKPILSVKAEEDSGCRCCTNSADRELNDGKTFQFA